MSTVQWYSEFELQFNYQHDFMAGSIPQNQKRDMQGI